MPKPSKLSSEKLFPTSESSLPEELAQAGEKRLRDSRGLARASYTTEQHLGALAPRTAKELGRFNFGPDASLVYEGASPSTNAYCAEHGLVLIEDASVHQRLPTISAALTSTIKPLPFLYSSVAALTWRCHLVRAPEDDFDVSFSDPEIPFSVFVSVPPAAAPSSELRVAENLVHETMHLLLTLFECEEPLIATRSSALVYSPWKRELRPAQGVLHGLYVFAILRWMWQQTLGNASASEASAFARQRIVEIDGEVRAAESLSRSTALTATGQEFVAQLLDFARQPL
jgi:HEXXH motif-containing protein